MTTEILESAEVAVLAGPCAQLAAFLSALQIGLFLLLVWIPIIAAGSTIRFQWSDAILKSALLAAAWVVANSYRSVPSVIANSKQPSRLS